jgi:diaminohydroxyphosphoribosylaminopyrimidine deaminase / 5-amino-6-(5-phosphoribosylamino)uracil reductase
MSHSADRILAAARAVLGVRKTGAPVVTVSWAQSAAGAIARADGTPLRISGPQSMILTHRLRAMHDAILVGIQTVINDDPLLSVRLPEPLSQRPSPPHPQPQPVVLDSHLRFPAGARLLQREDRKPWLFHLDDPDGRAANLQAHGARLFHAGPGPGGLDLYEVLRSLGAAGVRSLMVEGGARVLRAFITAGFAEQVVVTVSPSVIQGLPGPGMPGLQESLSDAVGEDTVTWGTLNP